jgi:hypothetical protein
MRRRGLVSSLYRTARLANDVSAITSGNPHRIARRARNRIVGRALAIGGFWRMLWGRWASPSDRHARAIVWAGPSGNVSEIGVPRA